MEVLDSRVFRLGEKFEFAEFLFLGFLAFLIPFLVGHPQLLVGVLVNAFLVVASLNLDAKKVMGLALLPSLGAIARGMLFGPFTFALVFMVPFIWAGNMALILAMKYLFGEKRVNYFLSLGAGALLKAGLLFGAAYALLQFSLVPALFLEAMGIVQLITALGGGIVAFAVWRLGARAGLF
jgi:hypothetical protein